jgi:hypothetical protein
MTPTQGETVLKPTLAVKIAGGVLAAFVLAGGGIALAAESHSPRASTDPTVTRDEQANHQGTQGQDCGNNEPGDDQAGAEANETSEPSEPSEQGEDCDDNKQATDADHDQNREHDENANPGTAGDQDHDGRTGNDQADPQHSSETDNTNAEH